VGHRLGQRPVFDQTAELPFAGRLDLRRTRLLGGQEQRIADLPRVTAGLVIEERHWAVGDLELPDGDVVGELITEVGLQICAVIALRLGVDLDLRRRVVETGDDAVAILADRQRRLARIGLRGASDLFGAADARDEQGYVIIPMALETRSSFALLCAHDT
jgi:hypothetical protein